MKPNEAIAIVGRGGIFPGAPDLSGFWRVIAGGRDVTREVPAERWPFSPRAVWDARPGTPDRVVSLNGGFLENGSLDLSGLDVDSALIAELDPLFHLVLHAGRQAFQDAVTQRIDRRRIGVILGNIALPTEKSSAWAFEVLGPLFQEGRREKSISSPTHPLNRFVAGLPAGLLAKALGLGGGAYCIDAACAASLYALHAAVAELQSGRRDAMLAGGVSRPDCLYTQMGFSQLRALSPSGRCSPFDQKADGLIVGEGAGIFLLKRLSDALREGDRIYGLIRGIGLANDLRGDLLAPDSEGQVRAMRAAYAQTGWRPADLDLIECHGTGTPLGDATEIRSLRELWSGKAWSAGQCALGSVKSNVGHLLTGAGAAGLMKVLLALENEKIPPTANFENAPASWELEKSPFRVLTTSQPWERRRPGLPRRAGINAFGFGGINAHVLLEEWMGSPVKKSTRSSARGPKPNSMPVASVSVAIVGMDAHFGPWDSRDSFKGRIFGSDPMRKPSAPKWWGLEEKVVPIPGYYLDSVTLPLGEFHIPPKEMEELLPQQLLMLKVAAGALRDAQVTRKADPRTGVFVGVALDLNTTNYLLRWGLSDPAWKEAATPALNPTRTLGALGGIVSSRLAREFQFGGPSFSLSSEESSGIQALGVAVRSLETGEIDRALVGAVDICGDARAVLGTHRGRPYSTAGSCRPFSTDASGEASGAVPGEGAAAVVLKRLEDARRDGDKIYAVIAGLGTATGGGVESSAPSSDAYQRAWEEALQQADWDFSSVSYLEVHGSGCPEEDRVELPALRAMSEKRSNSSPWVLGSIKPSIGHAGAASALASVLKAALCLHHKVLGAWGTPGENGNFSQPCAPDALCLDRPQFWLRNRAEGPRRAGVAAFGVDGNCSHVLLEEFEAASISDDAFSPRWNTLPLPAGLFAVEGDGPEELRKVLPELSHLLQGHKQTPIHLLASLWWKQVGNRPQKKLGLAFLVEDAQKLSEEIERVQGLLAEGRLEEIAAPPPPNGAGSARCFFSMAPLAPTGTLGLVYPGSGCHYPGMGRELSFSFPEIWAKQDRENLWLKKQYLPEHFWYPPSFPHPPLTQSDLIIGQVTFGTAVTDLLHSLQIPSRAMIGYCLGESAGLFGLRIWRDRDEMLRRMSASPLFREQLGGEFQLLKKQWGTEDPQWMVVSLSLPVQELGLALAGEERIYLLVVSSPEDCVVGGYAPALQKFLKRLGCRYHPLQGIPSVHHPMLREVAEEYRQLHLFEKVRPVAGLEVYSGAWAKAYAVDAEGAADAIRDQALGCFDFPKLIEAAYQDGVRLFLEVGPGTSCSRMIQKILAGRPHWAQSAASPHAGELLSFLGALGGLLAQRVPMDRSALYGSWVPEAERILTVPNKTRAEITLPIGRGKIRIPAVPQPSRPFTPEGNEKGTLIQAIVQCNRVQQEAHQGFLRLSQGMMDTLQENLAFHFRWTRSHPEETLQEGYVLPSGGGGGVSAELEEEKAIPTSLNRAQCLEFARGSIAKVLGSRFAEADRFPTRVRLPDEPLMLVDRILSVEGEPLSLKSGRVVTEHLIHPQAWYLDQGRIPTAIAIEAGQADLFLSGFLGIDFKTKGLARYRLLDAEVTFHHGLPGAGQALLYDIRIAHFFRQGDTQLFRFHFDATLEGKPFATMRNGCAGFFTDAELEAGEGVVLGAEDFQTPPRPLPEEWIPLVPMIREFYDEKGMQALREGRLADAFGESFRRIGLKNPPRLPGGRLKLLDRVRLLDPQGGPYGLGTIQAELDIHPDDWFLTCHFSDDPVMPGTLMYECCLHAIRIYMMRLGWVGEAGEMVVEPISGIPSQLKCRGQVLPSTRLASFEIHVKELGFRPEPYLLADALMYADGKRVVEVKNIPLQCTGLSRERLEKLWRRPVKTEKKPDCFGAGKILSFSTGGKPSLIFGGLFQAFDGRFMARLPAPPYQFLDRVTELQLSPGRMVAGGSAESQYDIPSDAWYFFANRQEEMPYAVLLEVALQTCGFVSAYMGSALSSPEDLHYRNLGGRATRMAQVDKNSGTLTTQVRVTQVSQSAGMVIQNFDFEISQGEKTVFKGDTYFGFFSKKALAHQIGLTKERRYVPSPEEEAKALSLAYPTVLPFPDGEWRMVSSVDRWNPAGGPEGLGWIRGSQLVDPTKWYFKAHFYQDPVVPGSLGLESLLQLLKFAAVQRWGGDPSLSFESMPLLEPQVWTYRGQILPTDRKVTVETVVTRVDDKGKWMLGEGCLSVDGRWIYYLSNFGVRLR